MGGYGSGNWMQESRKKTTEDYFALDIRAVRKFGLLADGQEEIRGVAEVEWAPAGFGTDAKRPWFLCPRGCGRRAAILYGDTRDRRKHPGWACRRCRKLRHPVENETGAQRALRSHQKAHRRAGKALGLGDPSNPYGGFSWVHPAEIEKLKRMRRETFLALSGRYAAACLAISGHYRDEHSAMVEKMEWEKREYDL